jgi:magnesium-transporting ATPase (P-type)
MFNNDPIWLLLNRFLKLNSRLRSLLFAIGIGGLTFFLIPFFSGYLFPRNDGLSSVHDWPGLIITFFTHPAIYLYYCFEQEQILTKLINRLAKTQELADHQMFEEKLLKTLNLKRWIVLAFLLTAIGYFLHVQAVLAHPILSYYYPNKSVLFFINAPLSSLAGYMVCLVAIRYLIVVVSLFNFFNKHRPKIDIFHPDGCGGLSFVGRFVFSSFVLVAIMAIDLSLLIVINLQQINRDPFTEPSFLSLLGFYLILLPFSIVIPLLSPRNNIQNIKQNWQSLIETKLDKQASALSEAEASLLDSNKLDNILRLRKLYKLSNLSVIPIDKTTFVQFILLILISLLPILYLIISKIIFGGA